MSISTMFSTLHERELKILECITQGIQSHDLHCHLNIKQYQVKYTRANLKKKFNARTNLHLIVLAIQNQVFFNMLWDSTSNPVQINLTYNEVQIVKLLLVGYRNKEIAEKIKLSERTVQLSKRNFRENSKVESDAEFVKSALINGILSIIPQKFTEDKIASIEKFDNHIFKIIPNDYGSIYFDAYNRFYLNIPLKSASRHILFNDYRLLGIILSEIPESIFYDAVTINISEFLLCINTWNRIREKMGDFGFLLKLIESGILSVQSGVYRENPFKNPINLIILEHLIEGSSYAQIASKTHISMDQVHDLIEDAFVAFNCSTPVTFLIEAMSLGIIRDKIT